MEKALHRHGWPFTLAFGCSGPVVFVTASAWMIEMPLPVRLDDDHSQAMDGIYALYAQGMCAKGAVGRA